MIRFFACCALIIPALVLAATLANSSDPEEQVLQRLAALDANQSIVLGNAEVVGDFNSTARQFGLHRTGPRARDYSLKMVWVPELHATLYAGANHGSPHRLNDVWAFDLARMQWRLLYAPDNPRSYTGLGKDHSDVEYRDGTLQTLRGGPAVIGHSWWGLTWDPDLQRLLFMNTWVTDQERAIRSLGADPSGRYKGAPLWSFDPRSGNWQLIRTGEPWPRAPFGGMLEYIPPLKGSIWHANNWQMRGSWLLESGSLQWQKLNANKQTGDFEREAPTREQIGYYDATRNLLIAQSGQSTHHFNVDKLEWRRVLHSTGGGNEVPMGHDARSVIYFDPISGHGLLLELDENRLWAYDPDSVVWSKVEPKGSPIPTGKKRLAYFDPDRNVFVILKDTEVWAYRYKGS